MKAANVETERQVMTLQHIQYVCRQEDAGRCNCNLLTKPTKQVVLQRKHVLKTNGTVALS